MRTFYLWSFGAGVITRGETAEQAWEHARKVFPSAAKFEPNLRNFNLVDSARLYTNANHKFDWLHIAPYWLQQKESHAS